MKLFEVEKYRGIVRGYLNEAGIVISAEEASTIEIADLGLGIFEQLGVSIIVYHNDEQYCAKELIMLPGQTNPQHRHPPIPSLNYAGKQETFRCRWGTFYLYIEGEPTPNPAVQPPEHLKQYYDVWHEIILNPGDQFTIAPMTWHWFQGGPTGAICSEFSTRSVDEADQFTNPDIQRLTKITE